MTSSPPPPFTFHSLVAMMGGGVLSLLSVFLPALTFPDTFPSVAFLDHTVFLS
jgi:hypothetical protein